MEVKASLKYARVGAQKARLVADVVRGKNVDQAIKALTYMDKKTAGLLKKLIESAVANATDRDLMDVDSLYVKSVWVDAGPVLKRFMPRGKGSASGIRKKTSHINLILGER